MKNLVSQLLAIQAPSDAQAIHELVIQLWEAGVALQDAGNRFWLLLMSEGVEDWVQR
jgi:hypothetical protein